MLRGYLYIIFAAALWGLIGPLGRLAFSQGVTPMEVAFWRAVLAWGFFGTHAALTRQMHIEKKDVGWILLFAFTGVTLFYGSYQLAVNRGGAALAAVLLYTAPAWVALMSGMIFKEPMTRVKLTALLLTLAGVAGVSAGTGDLGPEIKVSFGGILFGLIAGFCYALYYIFGKFLSGRYTSPNLFFYILPIGALGLFPWVDFVHKSPTAWMALILLAFLCTYSSYFCYYLGLKFLEPTRAAITATLEPVMAAIIAYFWWGEYFTFIGYVGSGLILSSVLLMVWDGTRAKALAGSVPDTVLEAVTASDGNTEI